MNGMHSSDDQIADYVMGSLVGEAAQQFEAHVETCLECAEKLQTEAMLEEQLFVVGTSARNVVPKETPVQWRPAAAAALLNLVDEPVSLPTPQAPAAAVNEVEWQYPTAKKNQRTVVWPWIVLAASGLLLALCVGLVIGMRGISTQQPLAQAPIAAVAPASAPTPKTEVIPVVEGPRASGAIAALSVPAKTTPEQPTRSTKSNKGKNKDALAMTEATKPPAAAGKKDGFDDLLAGKQVQQPEPREKLSRDDVLGTVNANKASILKCAQAYASTGGKLPPKIMGKWTIKASGIVENVEMASPELKGTPLDACVVSAIKKWRFPEFRSGEIPVTFPFAVSQ